MLTNSSIPYLDNSTKATLLYSSKWDSWVRGSYNNRSHWTKYLLLCYMHFWGNILENCRSIEIPLPSLHLLSSCEDFSTFFNRFFNLGIYFLQAAGVYKRSYICII